MRTVTSGNVSRRRTTSRPTRWALDVYDTATQSMSSNYVEVVDGRGEYTSIPFRYVWPADMPAGWLVACCFALIHACADEVRGGRIDPAAALAVLTATIRGMLTAPGPG